MLSVIIATRESERALVPTLAALVQGATAGLVGEVIVADANSRDATAEVADIAGCRLLASAEPLGARLKAAAASAKAPWLMFLRPGCVPEATWVGAVAGFIAEASRRSGEPRAAVFRSPPSPRPGLRDLLATLRNAIAKPKPGQGLLIAREFYNELGGHPPHDQAEAALLRLIGRRHIALLTAAAIAR